MDAVVTIASLRGGRNGVDPPIDPTFPMTQAVEMWNVDLDAGAPLGKKRGGTLPISTNGGSPFIGTIHSLMRHVPGGREGEGELWAVDSQGTPLWKRLASGVTWVNVPVPDPLQNPVPGSVNATTFNDKLFCAYNSGYDRLHCWDGTRFRRVGLSPGVAPPTVANAGSGSYAALLRYYRVRWVEVSGGKVIRRSEASPSIGFTPSGSGSVARILRPNAPGEGETHWEVEASTDDKLWYVLYGAGGVNVSTDGVPVATTSYDDPHDPGTYHLGDITAEPGTYSLIPSVKFLITDGNRLIMAGQWEDSTPFSSRIWHTPVLGSLDKGDDERLSNISGRRPFIDLNEKDGGKITGLGGPVGGALWAFKYRHVWRGYATGDVDIPYVWKCLSRVIGSLNHRVIVLAEDAEGRPALYFLSYQGPYRVGVKGIEYLGRDIEDVWYGTGRFSGQGLRLSETTETSHGLYQADKRRVDWYICYGPGTTQPNLRISLNVDQATRQDAFGTRGGWVIHSVQKHTTASVSFSTTIGNPMSEDLKPYLGETTASIIKADVDSALTDNGTPFQAYVTTRSIFAVDQLMKQVSVRESILMASAAPGVTIRQTVVRDFGVQQTHADVDLTPEGSEPYVIRKFDASMNSDLGVAQILLGDPVPQQGQWTLDALLVPVMVEGDK